MPLSKLLKSAAGTCPHCGHKASIISREHPECRRTRETGLEEQKMQATPVNVNMR